MPSYSSNPAMRLGLDAQVSFMTELTHRTYDAVRKLSELNMHFAQQLMQDSVDATRQLMTCSDPFQLAAVAANAAQPATQHLRSYQQQLVGMMTGVQVEMTRSAESLMPQGSRYTAAMVQSMARDNITSSDPLNTAVRSNANGGIQESPRGNGAQRTSG
jgi:phasin family protein